MKEGDLFESAPVAAVKRILADEVERASDRAAVARRKEKQRPIPHRRADALEEGARQIGVAPFAGAGVLVEMPHRVPVDTLDLAAAERDDVETGAGCGAFPADRLALAARQAAKEIL